MIAAASMSDAGIAALVAVGVLFVFVLCVAVARRWPRADPPESRLHLVDARLSEVEHRLDKTETLATNTSHDVKNIRMVVQQMPTKGELNRLAVDVAEIKGEMRGVLTTTSSMHRSLERVEGFLMDAAAKRIAGIPDHNGTDKS